MSFVIPISDIQDWSIDRLTGTVTEVGRRAAFWKPGSDKSVDCTLCYRRCQLKPGEAGFCRYRVNDSGKMAIPSHGVLVNIRSAYKNSFRLYKPNAKVMSLAAGHCTAHCTFCQSAHRSWDPDALPWAWGERGIAQNVISARRAMLHPKAAIVVARHEGCAIVKLGVTEPLLSWEYSYDVARLAKANRLDVTVETNGFSTPEAIRKLAPFVDAVSVGIKGSADPAFYDRWMWSPGAVPHVLASARLWREYPVHLTIGDVIAPPRLQDDATAEEAQKRLYSWVVENLGPLTPMQIVPMVKPDKPQLKERPVIIDGSGSGSHVNIQKIHDEDYLLPASRATADAPAYKARVARARELAREAGLRYFIWTSIEDETIPCHACGGVLVRFYVVKWDNRSVIYTPPRMTYEHHVTDSRCDHCGAAVPAVMLPEGHA